jgi:hypothetical protein
MTSAQGQPVPRSRPSEDAGERETLVGVLDFLRATVVAKVTGLSDEDAFSRPVAPSALSPAGVVRHLSGVERFWFSIDFAGADLAWPWTVGDPHGNFNPGDGETAAGIIAEYTAECERSRGAIADAALHDVARGEGMTFTLRYALVHMLEETARHCGHLDLLRERIDGVTGE